jgi:hypothetical protein
VPGAIDGSSRVILGGERAELPHATIDDYPSGVAHAVESAHPRDVAAPNDDLGSSTGHMHERIGAMVRTLTPVRH